MSEERRGREREREGKESEAQQKKIDKGGPGRKNMP
jgi:hypothetical protein